MKEEKQISVLLLEDNADDVFLLQQAMVRYPACRFEITTVERLRDALHILDEKPIDIIVTDLKVPDGMGVEIVQQLSAQSEGTPIIVLTGFADDVLISQLARAGARESLVKSGDCEPVVQAVIKVLEEHAERR